MSAARDLAVSRLTRVICAGVLAALPALGLVGCVSQEEYDRTADTARGALNGRTVAERERDEARAAADLMRNQLLRAEAAQRELEAQNSQMRAALEASGLSIKELEERMKGLAFGPLDPTTNQALTDLAAQFPDLITYDEARGMLRFNADLTFDSGSAVVKDTARSSLQALAKVLNSSSASAYEVHIVGHTDSQKISSRTASQHPTNMHLSCHRSISVRSELIGMGVEGGKMEAAGWGEFRPIVPNSATGNTPANRRVEVYLARATGSLSSGDTRLEQPTTGGRGAPERSTPPTRQPEVTK
jgi:chemotaxis protein MotB